MKPSKMVTRKTAITKNIGMIGANKMIKIMIKIVMTLIIANYDPNVNSK